MHEVVLPSIVFQTQTTYEGHFRENSKQGRRRTGGIAPLPFQKGSNAGGGAFS